MESGVERFVVDDGWFGARRDDTAGLGDWQISQDVWPDGDKSLKALADYVHGKGLEFGLWFEPEMVNPDSDMFRNHPDWVLKPTAGRLPMQGRTQQVVDLTNPDAYDYIYGAMDKLVSELGIDYIKWDHNKLVTEEVSPLTGRPAAHAQTLAGTDRRQRATDFGQQRLHLPHMRHPRQTEDTQRLVVDLVDAAPVVDGQQPRAGALHDKPVIAFAFLGTQLGPHDDLADTVQRHVERPFAAGGRTLAETEIQIVVFDGIEQKGHTAHRRVVQPHEPVDRDAAERQKQQGEGITPRRRQRSGSGRHGDQHDDVGYQTEEIATVFHKP